MNMLKKYNTEKPLEKELEPVGMQMIKLLADPSASKTDRDMAISTLIELLSLPIAGLQADVFPDKHRKMPRHSN